MWCTYMYMASLCADLMSMCAVCIDAMLWCLAFLLLLLCHVSYPSRASRSPHPHTGSDTPNTRRYRQTCMHTNKAMCEARRGEARRCICHGMSRHVMPTCRLYAQCHASPRIPASVASHVVICQQPQQLQHHPVCTHAAIHTTYACVAWNTARGEPETLMRM